MRRSNSSLPSDFGTDTPKHSVDECSMYRLYCMHTHGLPFFGRTHFGECEQQERFPIFINYRSHNSSLWQLNDLFRCQFRLFRSMYHRFSTPIKKSIKKFGFQFRKFEIEKSVCRKCSNQPICMGPRSFLLHSQ